MVSLLHYIYMTITKEEKRGEMTYENRFANLLQMCTRPMDMKWDIPAVTTTGNKQRFHICFCIDIPTVLVEMYGT